MTLQLRPAYSRNAVTFEPLVLRLNGNPDMGSLSYHHAFGRFVTVSGLTRVAMRSADTFFSIDWSLGLGADLWLFGSKPFEGFFVGKQIETTYVWAVPANHDGYYPVGPGFSLDQDLETGYQWNISDYLLAIRMGFNDLFRATGFGVRIGRAW